MNTCDWDVCDFVMASTYLGRVITEDTEDDSETFEGTNYESIED